MLFTIAKWVGSRANRGSVFGAVDPGKLAMLSARGRREDFRTIDEAQQKIATETNEGTANEGWCLIGASFTVTEVLEKAEPN